MSTAAHHEPPRIERRALRAYSPEATDLIISLVNEFGVRYRLTKNTILLYPPDGSTPPFTIPARAHWRVAPLVRWAAKHIPEVGEALVSNRVLADVRARVEKEKQKDMTTTEPAEDQPSLVTVTYDDDEADDLDTATDSTEGLEAIPDGWEEWHGVNGDLTTMWMRRTTDALFRCRACGTETYDIHSLGGHTRMQHRSRASLYTPEAKAKALASRRQGRVERTLRNERDELRDNLDQIRETVIALTGPAPDRIEELEREVETLRADLADMTTARDEAVARLALIKEAMKA